jgi:hypothetical protein
MEPSYTKRKGDEDGNRKGESRASKTCHPVNSIPHTVEDANNSLQVPSPLVTDHFLGVGAVSIPEAQLEAEDKIEDGDGKRDYISIHTLCALADLNLSLRFF